VKTANARHTALVLIMLVGVIPVAVLAQEGDIRLGYLLDLSNKGAFLGQQSRAGAELAVQELAHEGVQVEVLFEDHRTQGKAGVSGARKLLSIDKVDAIMCDLTPACIAASPSVREAKKLFVYQAPIVSILKENPYSFKNFLDYKTGCRQIGQLWKSRGIKRIAHFQVNAEFGELCVEGSREIFPEQVVFEYDAGTELRSLVLRAKSSRPEAVYQTGYEGDYINRLRAEGDIGKSLPTGMPEPLLTATVIKSVNESALSKSITFGFTELSPDFIDRLKQANLYRSPVAIESAAIAYLHVRQLVSAIRTCRKGNIECQVSQMASSPRSDLLGFKGWDSRIAQYDYQLKQWDKGKLVLLDVEQSNSPQN